MTHFKTAVWCIVATVGGAFWASGVTPESNAFQNIASANIFRLHAPIVAPVIPPPKAALPPIALTGIFDGFNKLFAFIELSPPNQPKKWLKLSPGETDADVQVRRVDIKTGTVEIKVSDTITNLILNQNAPPAPAKPLPTTASAPSIVPSRSEPQLNNDQTALIIEAERERLRQAGDPQANLMPITHLTPAGAPGTEGSDFQPSERNSVEPLRKSVP